MANACWYLSVSLLLDAVVIAFHYTSKARSAQERLYHKLYPYV